MVNIAQQDRKVNRLFDLLTENNIEIKNFKSNSIFGTKYKNPDRLLSTIQREKTINLCCFQSPRDLFPPYIGFYIKDLVIAQQFRRTLP